MSPRVGLTSLAHSPQDLGAGSSLNHVCCRHPSPHVLRQKLGRGQEPMPKKEVATQVGRGRGSPQGQHCPLQGALGWSGQGLTLQLSTLAKNGEGMGDLCWPFPNITPHAAILSLGGQRGFYQL